MITFDQLNKSMLLLRQVAKEMGISMADMTSAMRRFNQHKHDGWDKRKIRRHKRRERLMKIRIKMEKNK